LTINVSGELCPECGGWDGDSVLRILIPKQMAIDAVIHIAEEILKKTG